MLQPLTLPISLDTVSDSLLVKQATNPICTAGSNGSSQRAGTL
jgi:hypothetical protein